MSGACGEGLSLAFVTSPRGRESRSGPVRELHCVLLPSLADLVSSDGHSRRGGDRNQGVDTFPWTTTPIPTFAPMEGRLWVPCG